MKVTTVKRYSCDFCKKKAYAAWAMRKHEGHCTLNPARKCMMCELKGREPPTKDELAQLVALVPDVGEFTTAATSDYGESIDAGSAADPLRPVWDKIIEGTQDCPACIMAVLRQAHFPLPIVSWWSYTDACKVFWDEINDAKPRYAWEVWNL